MRLVELNPKFLACPGAERTEGMGVDLDCPCGARDEHHRLYVPFENPIGPGPKGSQWGWHRTGDTFETLTLTPSIYRKYDCGWHGFITNGEVITV